MSAPRSSSKTLASRCDAASRGAQYSDVAEGALYTLALACLVAGMLAGVTLARCWGAW